MCGIAGLFEIARVRGGDHAAIARAMVDTLAHRGPDGSDAWGNAESA